MKIPFPFLLLTLLPLFSLYATRTQSDDFKIIKERVVNELMKSAVDDSRVKTILEKINDDGSFQGIDYSDLSRTAGFPHRNTPVTLFTWQELTKQSPPVITRIKRPKKPS